MTDATKSEPLTEAEERELRAFMLSGEPPVPKCVEEGRPLTRLLATLAVARAERDEARAHHADALEHIEGLGDALHAAEREAGRYRETLEAAADTLELLSDGACDAKYGPGCDTRCKQVAFSGLSTIKHSLAAAQPEPEKGGA